MGMEGEGGLFVTVVSQCATQCGSHPLTPCCVCAAFAFREPDDIIINLLNKHMINM